jgi:hypothetical protein
LRRAIGKITSGLKNCYRKVGPRRRVGGGFGELLAIQIVFPIVLSIASSAAYDVLKAQFLRWKGKQNNRSQLEAPLEFDEPESAEKQLKATLCSLGFNESDITELVTRARNKLTQ